MRKHLGFISLVALLFFSACERELEEPIFDPEFDFQPLVVGNFWIYEVDQTIYFGENDSEQEFFFIRDHIRTFYLNAANEQVFIVERLKSNDKQTWVLEKEYTLILRDFSLIKTVDNQPLVSFVFPPKIGRVWNGNIYRNDVRDDFEIDIELSIPENGIDFETGYRVLQEESDDQITFRDIRFEYYAKGIGMTKYYAEVLTYCSRNDCLGDEIIDSGYKTQMDLIEYGND
jgi:hypothetical protein